MTMQQKQGLFIGLMSGTSMDGLDAVLVRVSNHSLHTLDSYSQPFSPRLRQTLIELCTPGENEIDKAGQASVQYAIEAAQCINGLLNKSSKDPKEILAIGCHGQTVRHRPELPTPFTTQLGDASTLAHHTGITVINDFRMADIAAGGQGAPLVPAFHKEIFSHPNLTRFIVNIGGIANISIIPSSNEHNTSTRGFDTGPGNTLLDQWIYENLNKEYDDGGNWARTGEIDRDLLNTLLATSYFSKPAPKSTGRELFNLRWLKAQIKTSANPNDVQRTLLELTAQSIVNAIKESSQEFHSGTEIYFCGGGVKNAFLMERIANSLPDYKISSTSELGLDPQLVEASAFAWLAKQALAGLPGNLVEATGASIPKVLGGIYPG